MIWGLTHEERKRRREKRRQPRKVIAWVPHRLEDGRIAWLEIIEKRACVGGMTEGRICGLSEWEHHARWPTLHPIVTRYREWDGDGGE